MKWIRCLISELRTFSRAMREEEQRQMKPGEGAVLDRTPDTARFTAPKRLAFPVFLKSEQMLRYHNRADWQYVDDNIALFAAKLVDELRKQGVPMWVFQAFRTEEQQNNFYLKGTSKLRWPRAPHCQGKAVDIVHGKFMWDLTPQEWAYVGKVGKDLAARLGINVEWGGDWSFYDPAHWQLADWDEDIRELEAGPAIRRTPKAILSALKGRLS